MDWSMRFNAESSRMRDRRAAEQKRQKTRTERNFLWPQPSTEQGEFKICRANSGFVQICSGFASCKWLITRHCSPSPAFIHLKFFRCNGMKPGSLIAESDMAIGKLVSKAEIRPAVSRLWHAISHFFPVCPSCKWLISRDGFKFPAFSHHKFFRCNPDIECRGRWINNQNAKEMRCSERMDRPVSLKMTGLQTTQQIVNDFMCGTFHCGHAWAGTAGGFECSCRAQEID